MRNWNMYIAAQFMKCSLVCSLPMRNWNVSGIKIHLPLSEKFVAYLWGIELFLHLRIFESCRSFVAYLWGIETLFSRKILSTATLFVAYLWGIETFKNSHDSVKQFTVCSLPMRNWNTEILNTKASYICVCSLPMRNKAFWKSFW